MRKCSFALEHCKWSENKYGSVFQATYSKFVAEMFAFFCLGLETTLDLFHCLGCRLQEIERCNVVGGSTFMKPNKNSELST